MILYYILKPLVILLNHTPRKVLHGMAKFMAFCLWHLSKDRRHVAATNAKILGAKDPYKTARKSFDYTFMAYLDIFYAHRIGDDYIKNKIFYYMQKNQDAQNSFDPNYNANVKDITFADEDISKMTSKEFSEVEHIINNQLENNRFLTKNEAQNRVQQGNLIWVDEYVRDDGTKVKGHYRAKAS